jgi:predicted CoA-binding protein
LLEHGHRVIPVHPAIPEIEGLPVFQRLEDLKQPVETLTVYVSPQHSSAMATAIVALKPKRAIFNPGTENPELAAELRENGIAVEEACTLVLLNTGQF